MPTAWERHTISTFRWKLIQVAGRIIHHAGQVILRLCMKAKEWDMMIGVRQKCFEESMTT